MPDEPGSGSGIAAVIVAQGDPELLNRCLLSLATSLGGFEDLDVVVVENGVPTPFDPNVEGVAVVALGERVPLDVAFLNGIQAAGADVALLVTPDIVFEPGFLNPLLATLGNPGGPDSVTPTVVRRRSDDDWVPGVSSGLSSGDGVCLLLRVTTEGTTCGHVESSVVGSVTTA